MIMSKFKSCVSSIHVPVLNFTIQFYSFFCNFWFFIILDLSPKIALHQAEKSLDHYRTTLKDQWNIHGLTSSEQYGLDGLPWATSHYSFHLMLWHLPLALSGQRYNAPNASLSFQPKFDAPYWLSFYTPLALGSIQAHFVGNKTEILYKFTVTSGMMRKNWITFSILWCYNSPVAP